MGRYISAICRNPGACVTLVLLICLIWIGILTASNIPPNLARPPVWHASGDPFAFFLFHFIISPHSINYTQKPSVCGLKARDGKQKRTCGLHSIQALASEMLFVESHTSREKEGRSVNFQSRECDMPDGVTPSLYGLRLTTFW